MNTAYSYKNGKNNSSFNNINSKRGNARGARNQSPSVENFVDRALTLIDSGIESLSSLRALVAAKALFAFITLLGFFGVIGGMELGRVSLITGVIALAILVGAEFLVLKD